MIQFFKDCADNPLLLTGLAAGVLASISCGMVGPYVITRRIVFLAGAVAHMAIGGVGAAILIRHHWRQALLAANDDVESLGALFAARPWFAIADGLLPMVGATLAAVGGAVIIGVISHRVRERLDTLIGAMWAMGMAIGVMLLKFTPGYHTELMSYLFGNISSVSVAKVWMMGGLAVVIAGSLLLLHKRLLAISLDAEHAELQGVNVLATNLALLVLVALAVICLMQVVGLILVLALLTLPAAVAGHHLQRLTAMMGAGVLLCAVLTTVPRIAVYGSAISPEASIVLAAGGVYLLSALTRLGSARAVGEG